MDATVDIPITHQDTNIQNERRRPPRNRQRNAQRDRPAASTSSSPADQVQGQQKSSRPPRGANNEGQSTSSNTRPDAGASGTPKRDPRPFKHRAKPKAPATTDAGQEGAQPPNPSDAPKRRGAKFGASLTEAGSASTANKPAKKYRAPAASAQPVADDLTSRLIHDLRTPPYPDCPICFSEIHPLQRTWSCSPSIPVVRAGDDEGQEQQYCWTTFHVKCIGSWAAKNVKAVADAWTARGEPDKKGDWRCPGCQAKREIVPSGASVIPPQSQNPHDSQPHTHVPIHAPARAKAVVDIHALCNVIQALVLPARLSLV
ncbi:hypothetical protein H0H92_000109 [Tricholoma furcatifolium]|nr:hypothetical protein H0H92_000109 [Tricholoma furcatifolium]